MKEDQRVMIIHFISGVLMGVISPSVNETKIAIFVGLCVLFILNKLSRKQTQQSFSWWFGNGGWPYLSSWFAVWVILANL